MPASFTINGDGGAAFPSDTVFREVTAAKAGEDHDRAPRPSPPWHSGRDSLRYPGPAILPSGACENHQCHRRRLVRSPDLGGWGLRITGVPGLWVQGLA